MVPSGKGFNGVAAIALLAGVVLYSLLLADNPALSALDGTPISYPSTADHVQPFQAISAGESEAARPTGRVVTLPSASGGGPAPMDPPYGPNVRVWNNSNEQSRPSFVVTSLGIIFVSFQHFNGADWDIYITTSYDDGHTWGTPIALANTTANETDPSLAVTSSTVFALFYAQDAFPFDMYFFHSTDGVTWRQGVRSLSSKPGLSNARLPKVVAQSLPGAYPEGIMVAAQLHCDNPTNCGGGSETVYWVGSRLWFMWPPSFDLANWYWGNPSGAPLQFLRPSLAWSGTRLYQALENETMPGVQWELMVLAMPTSGTGLTTPYYSLINSTAPIYPGSAANGFVIIVGGSFVNSTMFPSNPSKHNILYFRSSDNGSTFTSGVLDSSVTDQRSFSITGGGIDWHVSYYSDTNMTYQVSSNGGLTFSGPLRVSDNNGTAVNADLSTSIYRGTDGTPKVAWQDNRDGDVNIYFAANFTFRFWINATCGGLSPKLLVFVDGWPHMLPYSGYWKPWSSHAIEVAPFIPANMCSRCVFRRWSDGGNILHNVVATSNMSLLVEFSDEYLVQLAEVPPLPLHNITWNGTTYQGPTQLYQNSGTYTAFVPTPQVTAPSVRYNFTQWSDGDTSNPRTAVVPGPSSGCVNLTAMFQAEYHISVTSNPQGLIVGYDGVFGTAPLSFWAVDGSLHILNVSSPQPDLGGSPDIRYRFIRWVGGPPTLTWAVTVTSPATYTADFVKQIRFTVKSNIPGPLFNVTGADCGAALPAPGPLTCWVDEATIATIDAMPAPTVSCRMVFIQWNDGYLLPIRPASPFPPNATFIAFFEMQCSVTISIDTLSCWDAGPPTTTWYRMSDTVMIMWRPPTGLPPYERYRFKEWIGTGLGSYSGPDPVANITVLDDITETAYCYHELRTLVDAGPFGVLFYYVDDVNYTGLQTFWWLNGTTHWLNVTVTTQMGYAAGTRYVFVSWSGVDFSVLARHPPIVTSASTAGTHLLNFKTQYLVTLVSPEEGNLRCMENADCWYNQSATATVNVTTPWLSGTPSIRYAFQQWLGDASGNDTDFIIPSVNAPMTIGAEWVEEYKLGVLTDQSSFSCSPSSDCWFVEGTLANVTLADSIVPGPTGTRYLFDGWTGDATGLDPFPLVMNSPKNITTTWITQYQLTVTSTCGPDAGCGALYGGGWLNASTLASLSVTTPWTDSSGTVWDFDHWGGDAGGSQTTVLVTMDAPKNVTAVWKERPDESQWVLPIGAAILMIVIVLVAIFLLLRARKRKGEEAEEKGVEKTDHLESGPKTPP